MDPKSNFHIFVRALAVMNGVLDLYRDSPRFRRFRNCCGSQSATTDLGVAVYLDDPEAPDDFFTIAVRAGKFVLVEHGVEHTQPDWVVSACHLNDVANNPVRYLNNPSELDFDWLETRSGVLGN